MPSFSSPLGIDESSGREEEAAAAAPGAVSLLLIVVTVGMAVSTLGVVSGTVALGEHAAGADEDVVRRVELSAGADCFLFTKSL